MVSTLWWWWGGRRGGGALVWGVALWHLFSKHACPGPLKTHPFEWSLSHTYIPFLRVRLWKISLSDASLYIIFVQKHTPFSHFCWFRYPNWVLCYSVCSEKSTLSLNCPDAHAYPRNVWVAAPRVLCLTTLIFHSANCVPFGKIPVPKNVSFWK